MCKRNDLKISHAACSCGVFFFLNEHTMSELSGKVEICYQSTSCTFKRRKEGEESWRWRPYVKFEKH